uniref:VWFD domain-containing protein n=1 Tax=Panagrolaimus sp. ES5 TaxID=591445 RepID=A0AC34FH18_9BILA
MKLYVYLLVVLFIEVIASYDYNNVIVKPEQYPDQEMECQMTCKSMNIQKRIPPTIGNATCYVPNPTTLDPKPSKTPYPTPSKTPYPTPSKKPDPTPTTSTDPTPSKKPDPTPSKKPDPTPSKTPYPTPSKKPDPTPTTSTDPTPSKKPDPTPSKTPYPTPTTSTDPTPSKKPDPTTATSTDPSTFTTPNPTSTSPETTTYYPTPTSTVPPSTTTDPSTPEPDSDSEDCRQIHKQVCLYGDPQYTTLDGAHFNYHGTCPHVFLKSCNSNNEFEDFEVVVQNRRIGNLTAKIDSAEILLYNQSIYMDSENRFFVNEERQVYPYYFPSAKESLFNITLEYPWKKQIIAKNGFKIDFEGYTFCVSIPDCPEYFGSGKLCGLTGTNFDGNCQNDVEVDNYMQNSEINSCRYGNMVNTWANSFVVEKYFEPPHKLPSLDTCELGVKYEFSQLCHDAMLECTPIIQAKNGFSIFSQCKNLEEEMYQEFFDRCVITTCRAQNSKCKAFNNFVEYCQDINNQTLYGSWKNGADCQHFYDTEVQLFQQL